MKDVSWKKLNIDVVPKFPACKNLFEALFGLKFFQYMISIFDKWIYIQQTIGNKFANAAILQK